MLHKDANHRSLILQSSSQRLARSGEVLVALGRIAMHLHEVVLTAVSCLRSSAMHCMNRRSEHRSDDADEALRSPALDEFQICGVNLGFDAYALRTEGSDRYVPLESIRQTNCTKQYLRILHGTCMNTPMCTRTLQPLTTLDLNDHKLQKLFWSGIA